MNATKKLGLSDADLQLLLGILAQFPGRYYAYGSRTKGDHSAYSDIDLCVEDGVDLASLQEELYYSALPYKVDIKTKSSLNANFLAQISKDLILLNP